MTARPQGSTVERGEALLVILSAAEYRKLAAVAAAAVRAPDQQVLYWLRQALEREA
jgi:hypothetical protein